MRTERAAGVPPAPTLGPAGPFTLSSCPFRTPNSTAGDTDVVDEKMAANRYDIMALLRTMNARLESIETTVTQQGGQITNVAVAVQELQASQAHMDTWRSQMTTRLETNDRLIADLNTKAKKESPRHKMPTTSDDATMADATATSVPKTPPQGHAPAPSGASAPPPAPTHSAPRASYPSQRHSTDETENDYVVLVIFPTPVVRNHMKRHYQVVLDSLPPRVADDAIFRPPAEGTTFSVKFTDLGIAQLFLERARRYSYSVGTGPDAKQVQLSARFRKTDDRRARGRAFHPAYVAFESFGYDRETIVQRHFEEGGVHSTRVSLAQEDGSAMRLGVVQYDMLDDGTSKIRSLVSRPRRWTRSPRSSAKSSRPSASTRRTQPACARTRSALPETGICLRIHATLALLRALCIATLTVCRAPLLSTPCSNSPLRIARPPLPNSPHLTFLLRFFLYAS